MLRKHIEHLENLGHSGRMMAAIMYILSNNLDQDEGEKAYVKGEKEAERDRWEAQTERHMGA
jgi:hypothetical protein